MCQMLLECCHIKVQPWKVQKKRNLWIWWCCSPEACLWNSYHMLVVAFVAVYAGSRNMRLQEAKETLG